MDCAAHNGHENLIKLLIDCDAPIDPKDRSLASVSVLGVVCIVTCPVLQNSCFCKTASYNGEICALN